VVGLHLLHHCWNHHYHRRESQKAQEAEADKSQWGRKWIVEQMGQGSELYLFPCRLLAMEEQLSHAAQYRPELWPECRKNQGKVLRLGNALEGLKIT
jgi:hypothetical protein